MRAAPSRVVPRPEPGPDVLDRGLGEAVAGQVHRPQDHGQPRGLGRRQHPAPLRGGARLQRPDVGHAEAAERAFRRWAAATGGLET